jgi:hypothetical protein
MNTDRISTLLLYLFLLIAIIYDTLKNYNETSNVDLLKVMILILVLLVGIFILKRK